MIPDGRDEYRRLVDSAVKSFSGNNARPPWRSDQTTRAMRICYITVFTECDWRNYANVNVPGSIDILPNDGYPTHGGDHLSVGLYQQQAPWWGTPIGSMDPFVATVRFLTLMVQDVPLWDSTDEPTVCQAVQRSQFSDASNYRARLPQALAMEADPLYFTNGQS